MAPNRTSRGIRNNNPLNIRLGNSKWLGKIYENTDGSFEQFTSMVMGCRAAIILIRKYIREGYNTPRKIISRWAPPTENNTEMYIDRACRLAQLTDRQPIETTSRNAITRLLWAMAQVENGRIVEYENFLKAYDLLTPPKE